MKPIVISVYHVFLASPGDLDAERHAVRRFFDSYNRHTAARWNVRFTVIDWENYSSIGIGRPQELITEQTLNKYRNSLALVVGIMGQRFGSQTGTHESGTEEEFEWALESYIRAGFPEIKWFFRTIETFQAPSDLSKIEEALVQWKKVHAFKRRLQQNDPPIYYGAFSDTSDFREKLRDDLSLWLYDESRPWHAGRERIRLPKVADVPLAYYERLVRQFESLDIAGIDNDRAVDIPLSEVYVRLRVTRDEDVEGLQDEGEDGPIDIHAALGSYSRLVIVGDPGSGKSTFLKFIALVIARAQITNNPGLATSKLNLPPPLPIPFFVSLWDLSDFIKRMGKPADSTIPSFIASRLAEAGVALSGIALEEMLDSGICCLLFDGLDEVPTESGRALVSRVVERFVHRFDKNRFVVTSRVRGYTGDVILKGGFVRCDIQDFDESDRGEFLRNWFAALLRVGRDKILEEGSASLLEYEALRNAVESKDRIRMLAVNPLLMTVIAIVHWNRKRLPDQRVDLYDECVDVLLGQRKTAERVGWNATPEMLDETVEDLTQYDRTWTRKRFSEIALRILESGADEITRETVINLLVPRFRDRGAHTEEQAQSEAVVFLDRQELRSGLLVSRRLHSFRFVHLTFQEYLAAWNIANQSISEITALIGARLRNPQWFETLQLVGGELAKDSDEKLDQYINYLLDNIGKTIGQQAPVIALCANILQDIKAVADIKALTQEKYTRALTGTLDAFKVGSGVPAKTQLEVLFALLQLGSSVKEHLIQATKSSYYQVRSRALWMLVKHLSDEDLFGMYHILQDRSQETIYVYLHSLMERDSNRAVELLLSQVELTYKASKACAFLFVAFQREFPVDSVEQLLKKVVEDSETSAQSYDVLQYLISFPQTRNVVRRVLAELVENGRDGSVRRSVISLISIFYQQDEEMYGLLNRRAVEDDDALVRSSILTSLLAKHTGYDPVARQLLWDNSLYRLRDPREPISAEWVKQCSKRLNESEAQIWERFEKLARVLPLKLLHGAD